jgi:ABC-type branched-subunit amino acid transport system substrate-binding protein
MASCGVSKPVSTIPQPSQPEVKKNSSQVNNQEKTATAARRKDTVKIDLAKKRIEDSLDILYPVTIKPFYTMSVFLPLYLNDPDREQTQKTAVSVSEDFYRGLLIAADTLKNCGRNLNIHIYDSENPFLSQNNVDDSLRLTGTDLMIGPLLDKTQLTYLDTLSKKYKINWVSPLQTTDKCLNNNYYFESVPSPNMIGVQLAQTIMKEYPDYRVIIVNENSIKDNPAALGFYSQFPNKDSVKIINYKGQPASTFDPGFPLVDKDIIFITSKRESFVSAVLSKLRVSINQIVVAGTTPWLYFNSQEGDLWNKFNFHIATPFHMDYSDSSINNFIKAYRARYNEEPSVYAFFGFDEITYYGTMLGRYGRYFQRYLLNTQGTPMLHSTYNLKPDPKCKAWKNNYVNVLKFDDYQMIKVNE